MHIVNYVMEVVSCLFISHLEIAVVNISLLRVYHKVGGEGDGFKIVMNRIASMPEILEPMGRPSLWQRT